MRINLGLNLVSSQPLFSVGIGNLPETYGANKVRKANLLTCYQKYWKGLPSGRLSNIMHGAPENRCQRNESISDNSHSPTTSVNWRLPKPERP